MNTVAMRDYREILITGAFALDPAVTTLDELRAKTDAVMKRTVPPKNDARDWCPEWCRGDCPRCAPVLDETVEDDGIMISRELAEEIFVALRHAEGFAGFIPRRFANNSVADWAESVRKELLQATMRLRRTALSQEAFA